MAGDCRNKRSESTPALKEKRPIGKQPDGKPYQPDGKPGARTVKPSNLDPTSFLYSSDDDDDGTAEAQVVLQIREYRREYGWFTSMTKETSHAG